MTPPAPALPFSHAIKLGLTQALSLPWTTLGMAFARMLDGLSGVAVSAALFSGALGSKGALPALLATAVTAALISALLRALLLGGGLVQGAARMRTLSALPFASAAAEAGRRSFSYALLSALMDLVARSWLWLALGTSGWLFVRALLHKQGGVLSSAAFAFTLTVGLPLLLAVALVTEVAFARAIARGDAYAISVYEAVGALWRRPWNALLLFTLFALAGGVLQLPVSLMVSALTSSNDPFATNGTLSFAGQAVAVVLGSLIVALVDHARAQALLADELHAVSALPLPASRIPVAPVLVPAAVAGPVEAPIPVAPVVPPGSDGGAAS